MCNFSGMIKNVLPSLRQRAGPQRICSRQKSIRSGTARDSFSQTPHMRGKDDEGRLKLRHVGITPAYAGKRGSARGRPAETRDHPRMCGEKSSGSSFAVAAAGSPPHVRGKDGLTMSHLPPLRITPACAGKSKPLQSSRVWKLDHPRMCGEKLLIMVVVTKKIGSPPHVRGKVLRAGTGRRRDGITPACAGKSHSWSGSGCPCWDHPRMCGEKRTKRLVKLRN